MKIKCIKIVFLLILVHLAAISKANFSNDSTTIIKIGSINKLNTNFYSMPVILNYNDSIKDKIIDFQIDVQDKYFDEYKYLYSVDPKYFVTKNSTKKETILFNIETRDTNSKNYYKIKVRSRSRLDSNVAEYKTKGYLQQKNIIKKSSANFTSKVNLDFTEIYDATDKKIRIEKVEKEKSDLTDNLQNTLKSLSNTKSQKINFTWALTKSIQTKLTTIDSASLADTLQKNLDNYAKLIFVKEMELNTKKENIEKEIWSLENELEDIKTLLNKTTFKSPNITIQDNITEASEIVFKSSTYKDVKCKVFIYDPKVHTLDINYNSSFSKTINSNYAEGKNTLFMTNGGMFHSDFSPVGLLIIDGKTISKLNTLNPNKKENFYLLPNGLFYITHSGEGKVMETHTFKNQESAIPIKFASQSGPMLLINDKPNPNFVFKSDNDKIRSGVGEMKDGKLVFIVSEEPVNFYDFTLLFKNRYGCKNALFLDGAISEGYINTGIRTNISNRNFGSVISIYRKR